LRLRFSPFDKRVSSLPFAFWACLRVAGLSASGRITTPFPSQEITSASPGPDSAGRRSM